jgi:hypothetical protein
MYTVQISRFGVFISRSSICPDSQQSPVFKFLEMLPEPDNKDKMS